MMITVRGVYDGNAIRPLPSEQLPEVEHEVPVEIIFLEDDGQEPKRRQLIESALRLRARRDSSQPLGMTVAELLEEGRER
ncbi:MAG: hypothetical protein AB7P14_04305 [Blastocatellales bacterium]